MFESLEDESVEDIDDVDDTPDSDDGSLIRYSDMLLWTAQECTGNCQCWVCHTFWQLIGATDQIIVGQLIHVGNNSGE